MKINLDNYQRDAVYTDKRNVLVVAAPGSGKTTVIINRINYLVMEQGIKEWGIIVITFTRAAADNMRNRYKNIFNRENAPFFGTFHGLFYKILLKEGYEVKILDGAITHKIIKSILFKYNDDVNEDKIREVIGDISAFKTSRTSLEEYKSKITKEIFKECYKAYEGYKSKSGTYDFDDLAIEIIKLFSTSPAILQKYRSLFKYILVDEFQDCDDLQIQFLKLLNEKNSLFAVGDEDQCIYSFRGSKPEYMVTFDKTFKESIKLYLSINYRSCKNIVIQATDVIKNNKERNNKEINAYKDFEGVIQYNNPYDELEEGEQIAKIIKSLNEPWENSAILFRTNIEGRSFIDTLTRHKIPFVLLDKGYNFFEHFVCKDLINYLKLAVNNRDREAFTNIINKPFRYISKSNIEYVRQTIEDNNPFDILINKEDTPPFQAKKLDELKKDISYLNKVSLGSAIQYIISTLGYIDYLKEYCEKYGQSLEDLEDILQEFKIAATSFKTINDLFVHIENVKNEIEKSKGEVRGVILSTIHGVKGMEFNNVFLVNAVEEIIPHKSSIENNIEEERRLFYVGITRAINKLYIFSPKTIRGKFKDVSRFVVEGGFTEVVNYNDYGFEIGDSLHHRTYGQGEVRFLEGDTIKIAFEDGVVRGFSIKILVENNLVIRLG